MRYESEEKKNLIFELMNGSLVVDEVNDPELRPRLLWRAHANNLYTNWLNYYVYQCTPYDLEGTPF